MNLDTVNLEALYFVKLIFGKYIFFFWRKSRHRFTAVTIPVRKRVSKPTLICDKVQCIFWHLSLQSCFLESAVLNRESHKRRTVFPLGMRL